MLPAGSPEGRFANRPYFFQAARRLGHGTALDILTAWSSAGATASDSPDRHSTTRDTRNRGGANYRVRRWQGAAFLVGLIAGGVVVLATDGRLGSAGAILVAWGLTASATALACPAEMVPA